MEMNRANSGAKKAGGRDFKALSKPTCANRFRTGRSFSVSPFFSSSGTSEENTWNLGVSEMGRNLRSHGSSPKHGCFANFAHDDPQNEDSIFMNGRVALLPMRAVACFAMAPGEQ